MKQILKTLFIAIVLVLGLFWAPSITNATTPTLSVYTSGGNDSVNVNVYGDSYSSVTMHYQNSNYGTQSQYLGTTNSNGYFSVTINASTYGIVAGSFVRVVVNNQTSSDVVWPYSYNNYNYNQLTLSQANISVSVGQSSEVTINGGNMPYTMYPVGANIFQAVISGNKLLVSGLNTGNGSINVCSSGGLPAQAGTGSGCAILSVAVNQNNYYPNPYPYNNYWQPAITFSQNNPNLSIGQSMTIQMSGGNNYYNYNNNNSYYVGHNSNSNNVSATVSGNSLTLRGLANGNMSIVVCSSSANCSSLNVIVGSTNTQGGGNWISCAGEGQSCYFSGTKTVQYGANGLYVYRTVSNGTPCSNAIFGDPIFGIAKRCSYSGENYQ